MPDLEAEGRDYSEPDLDLRIDPDGDPYWMAMWGMKKSGKSVLARLYFESWPYDRLAIDPARDFDPGDTLTSPWPGRWEPLEDGQRRRSYHYRPDRRNDPAWRERLDDVLGAVLDHHKLEPAPGPILLHIDEIIAVYKANNLRPCAETLLNEGRHYGIFQSTCGPRPVGVDPLSVSQPDDNFVFLLPHELDRNRIADNAGVPRPDLEQGISLLEPHGFLRITTDGSGQRRLIVYPPVPL